jgi:hypothetical protein
VHTVFKKERKALEVWLCKHEALNSNSSPAKKKKKKEKEGGKEERRERERESGLGV